MGGNFQLTELSQNENPTFQDIVNAILRGLADEETLLHALHDIIFSFLQKLPQLIEQNKLEKEKISEFARKFILELWRLYGNLTNQTRKVCYTF